MQQLLAYIHSITPFSEKSWQTLLPALTELEFKKDQLLLEKGEICDALFYINKGYCRAFQRKDGREINTAFFFENDIAANINSFVGGKPSAFSIQACEDTTVIRFDKKGLRTAGALDPEIEVLGKKCLQQIAVRQEKLSQIDKLMTAQERYEYLAAEYPVLLQRVPLTQLASYLGIARETLSRIRSRRHW
ncbi:MAG: Crp/Fnr family transcriptional regulator [Chitinophagaceae bacterium]|nr:Crp/Fnr family transcriptional regulator [Chitinophagaceae bacterium]